MGFKEFLDQELVIKVTWRTVVLVGLLSPVPVVAILLLPWGAESAPAWVQDLGSIGAVAAAIFIASGQQRRQEQVAIRKDQVVIKAIAEIARRGSMWVDHIHRLAREGQAQAQRTLFIQAIDAVEREWQIAQSIRLTDLPDPSLVDDFSMLERNLRNCVDSAREYLAGARGDAHRNIGIRIAFNRDIVRDIAKRLATEIKES